MFGFAGVSIDEEGILCIRPHMPKEWNGLKFRIHYQNSWIEISVTPDNDADVKVLEGSGMEVKINGKLKNV